MQETVTSREVADSRLPRRRPSAWLLPLVGFAAIAALAWLALDTHNTVNDLRGQLAVRLTEADKHNQQTEVIANQARQDTRDALAKLSVLENKLGESQNQQVALEALYQDLSKNGDELSLAEIEAVLESASQQLQLAGNVKAALIAMQSVDARLARADNKSRWTTLRRALNQDMERLRALPFVDTVAVSAKLDNLIANVDNLPLLSEPVISETNPPSSSADNPQRSWSGFGKSILHDLGELVRIRNLNKPDVPLLPPSQAYFLRENLKLRLLNARLALLAHNESSYKSDLASAGELLTTYFDPRIKAVTTAEATLRQLAANPVSITAADITDSLNALRTARLAHDKANR